MMCNHVTCARSSANPNTLRVLPLEEVAPQTHNYASSAARTCTTLPYFTRRPDLMGDFESVTPTARSDQHTHTA